MNDDAPEGDFDMPVASMIGHNGGPAFSGYDDTPSVSRWIAISTDMRFHHLVGCGQPVKPADPSRGAWSRYEAWQDLICEAAWKNRQVLNKGRTILLERGQLLAARNWLAMRWNWTEKQVRGWLLKLEEASMVDMKSGKQEGQQKQNTVTVLSVCNYDIYQTARELQKLMKGQQKDKQRSTEGPAEGQQAASEGPDLIPRNKDTKERERERCVAAEAPPPEPIKALPPVRMNCTEIVAPNFTVPYSVIDVTAESAGLDPERARKIALACAEEWNANGKSPRSQSAVLLTAFRKHVEAGKPKEDAPVLFDLGPADVRLKRVTKAGIRLAEDFVLPEEWRIWAKQEHGLQDNQIDTELKKFVRYWTSPDAKNPAKKDWKRTWQNWIDGNVSSGRIAKPAAVAQQSGVFDPIPPRESNCPDVVWQKRLGNWIATGTCTIDQAIARGYQRP